MFGSDMLGVAVGLVLLFLLVSLICTAAREGLEAVMRTRAMDLERGIRELLDDPDGSLLTRTLFDHPMIFALFNGSYDPAHLKKSVALTGTGRRFHMRFSRRRNLPSYIPAGHLATALIDIVARGPSTPAPYPDPGAQPLVPLSRTLSIGGLRDAAVALPNEKLQRAVLSAIDFAEGDLNNVKAQLENWFNGTMDRASGWYKRRTQLILFLMGLFVAAVLNIDAIEVARQLYREKALRDAAVARAETIVASGTAQKGPGSNLAAARENIDAIGYPIGWRRASESAFGFVPDPQTRADSCSAPCPPELSAATMFRIGLGWLITALATMLGAPFWFDLLNKIMVIRSTVKPHEKSPEEASEDRQGPPPARAQPAHTASPPQRGDPVGADPIQAGPSAAVAPFVPHTWSDGSEKGDL